MSESDKEIARAVAAAALIVVAPIGIGYAVYKFFKG